VLDGGGRVIVPPGAANSVAELKLLLTLLR
jgi:hypothetical protein